MLAVRGRLKHGSAHSDLSLTGDGEWSGIRKQTRECICRTKNRGERALEGGFGEPVAGVTGFERRRKKYPADKEGRQEDVTCQYILVNMRQELVFKEENVEAILPRC
jgi:hypothetical protein